MPLVTGCQLNQVKEREVARPERFELPTFWFVARRSIQLSYGRVCSLPEILGGAVGEILA